MLGGSCAGVSSLPRRHASRKCHTRRVNRTSRLLRRTCKSRQRRTLMAGRSRHTICPSRRGGPAVGRLRAARPVGGRATSCGTRAPADVPRRGRVPPRRRGRAALCRGGVSDVPGLRVPRWRVRTIPVRRVPDRAPGRVLVQGPRVLPVVWRASHDRARGAFGGPRHPGCPGSTVGLDAAAPFPVPAGLAPRPVQGRGARFAAGGALASARPRQRARPR